MLAKPVKTLVYQDTRVLDNRSFNYRAWAGLAMIEDVLKRAGVEVGATDAWGASGSIVLATVPSAPSWYSLINDWTRAKPQDAVLIIGGSGVLNVRPFLPLPGAVFVLGRGEDLILPLVQAIQRGERLESTSVVYPDTFSPDQTYRIHQGSGLYPYPVVLMNGKPWQEIAVGCRNRCFFCNYAWTRTAWQPDGDYSPQISARGALAGASNLTEHNLNQIVRAWRRGERISAGQFLNSAIDGQSQRLRRQLKKPVRRADLVDFARLAPHNTRASLMTVIGFPTETPEDRYEAIGDLIEGLKQRNPHRRWSIELSPNSFRPMPATPLALWPADVREWGTFLRGEWGAGVGGHTYRIWSSGNVGIKLHWGTGGAAHLLLDLLALRGTEDLYEAIVRLSQTGGFWKASAGRRRATLERFFPVDSLVKEYNPGDYPVRYLEGHTPNRILWPLGARALARLRGDHTGTGPSSDRDQTGA